MLLFFFFSLFSLPWASAIVTSAQEAIADPENEGQTLLWKNGSWEKPLLVRTSESHNISCLCPGARLSLQKVHCHSSLNYSFGILLPMV